MTKTLNRLSILLFYILILFLPTQLSRHFFFDFTQISGIRSDYLTPTIYLTDVLIIFLILVSVIRKKRQRQGLVLCLFLLSVVCYLLFNTLFIAVNKWAAVYKLIKITEFILLGVAVIRLRPKLTIIASLLSVSVFYSSIIAVWQFLIQKSIGGAFWFLGERTFYAATPGIAAFSYKGNLLLRPYATFPHPNVLGGFLAVVLPFILFSLIKNWQHRNKLLNMGFIVSLVFGLTALVLSFSRVAWLVALVGFVTLTLERKCKVSQRFINKKKVVLSIFYLLIMLSVAIPLFSPGSLYAKLQYWQERADLIKTTISMVSSSPLFGVGLNNSIIQLHDFAAKFPGLYIFQPVHNVYLLILAETGVVGFAFFLLAFVVFLKQKSKMQPVFLYSLIQLFILGLFDHYLFTLQQGQLLLVIFTALYLNPKVAY